MLPIYKKKTAVVKSVKELGNNDVHKLQRCKFLNEYHPTKLYKNRLNISSDY